MIYPDPMPAPKKSVWYSTPQEKRHRKQIVVMLSDDARAALERLVEAEGGPGMRSKVVEDLILAAEEKMKKR